MLGKKSNAGKKSWTRRKEVGASERAGSSGAGVKRSTAPRASADMQNVQNVQNMQNCNICKTCTILYFFTSGKIRPHLKALRWIRLKWKQGSLFLPCIELLLIVRCWNRHKSPTKKIVSWPPFPSLASDPRGRVVKCRLASRNATNLACYSKPHPDLCPLIITTYVTFLHDI